MSINQKIGDTAMTRTMTQEQFDAYLDQTGYGIASENENVAYLSDKTGDIVAMYWRGKVSYLETLDKPIVKEVFDYFHQEPSEVTPKELFIGGTLCVAVMIISWIFMSF